MGLGRRPSVQVEGQISPTLAARLAYVAVATVVGLVGVMALWLAVAPRRVRAEAAG